MRLQLPIACIWVSVEYIWQLFAGINADLASKRLLKKIFVDDAYNPDAIPDPLSKFLYSKIIEDPQFLSSSPWNLLLNINESLTDTTQDNTSKKYEPVYVSIRFDLTKLIDLVSVYITVFTGWLNSRVAAQLFWNNIRSRPIQTYL